MIGAMSSPSKPDENEFLSTAELVRRAKDGEPGGFAALYSRTAPALYAWAETRLPASLERAVTAEDVVQETYLRAYDRFKSYDDTRPFRSWLFGIASNVTRESIRSLARSMIRDSGDERLADIPDEARAISREVARGEAMRRFVERVRNLPEIERKVLLHRGLEGIPHAKVAALLGITVMNAEKIWQRVRNRLADEKLPAELFA